MLSNCQDIAGSVGLLIICFFLIGFSQVNAQSVQSTTGHRLVISRGGIYRGSWDSNDPDVPVVTINTKEHVTITDSLLSGRGSLIRVANGLRGANVTIQNVRGIALDPLIRGKGRGDFFHAEEAKSIIVRNCTMVHVRFGIYILHSNLSHLVINNNLALNMEDRDSDGHGGLSASRTYSGHFIQLNRVSVPKGGTIAWNQVINVWGQSSVEDVIDIYDSRGSAANAIVIMNNYIQGAFSSGAHSYSGGGIMVEGSSNDADGESAFIRLTNNVITQTGNYGLAISSGHDISMIRNRVVSCGTDASGNWIASRNATAAYLWNIADTNVFYNNIIVGTTGGLVRPDDNGLPMTADLWAPSVSAEQRNLAGPSFFTDPCFSHSSLRGEDVERRERDLWKLTATRLSVHIGAHAKRPY